MSEEMSDSKQLCRSRDYIPGRRRMAVYNSSALVGSSVLENLGKNMARERKQKTQVKRYTLVSFSLANTTQLSNTDLLYST